MKRRLAAAAAATKGILQGEDREFAAVSTDTRTLGAGDLFVALRGPNHDGHRFLGAAARAGAAGAMVSGAGATPDGAAGLPLVVVEDTLGGLAALAHEWRSQFRIPVVGVGGSNGKTTVKEMIASILSRDGACLATRGNLNNHIGVPLTLMRLARSHRTAVIEMGANHIGEVAALCAIAHPTVGLITNAGAEHLEGFGSLEGVARGEGEMVATLPADGTAVINADDPFAPLWKSTASARRVLTFGMRAEADFRATGVSHAIGPGGFSLRFQLHVAPEGGRTVGVCLNLAGRHNVLNALAAAAAAHAAGASADSIVHGLAAVRPVAGRLQLKQSRHGAWLVDDSYNANPSSMQAALEVLRDLEGERWVVMGDMAELGEFASQSHRQAGEQARNCGISRLFAIGDLSALAVQAFGSGAEWFDNVEALIGRVDAELERSPALVTLLIKGSRMNRLERVVEALGGAVDAGHGRH
jgi:UDP-N-acetylmuramoyl-tripeptide--D-alanyl-D-alanine ligase